MRTIFTIAFCFFSLPAFAVDWWGFHPDGGTLYFYTNTLGQDGAGETPSSEAIAVYKDGSDTELTTGATIDDDIDSKTGLHRIAIDTTQTGFDVGSTYTVVYTAGTSDSVSITGRAIGSFYLGPPAVDASQLSGSSTAADNAEIVLATDFATNYDTTADMWNANVKKWLGTLLTEQPVEAPANFGDLAIDGDGVVLSSLQQLATNSGGRVWHVDDSASGAGTGYNPTDAFTTISAAISAASPGDTIFVAAGTYSGNVNLNKDNITMIGVGDTTVITHNSGNTFDLNADWCTLRSMRILSTDVTSSSVGLDCDSTRHTQLYDLELYGAYDGLQAITSLSLYAERLRVSGESDAGDIGGSSRCHYKDCTFTTNATLAGSVGHRGLKITGATGVMENCAFIASRTAAGSIPLAAVETNGLNIAMDFLNCRFSATASHASNTSTVSGISWNHEDGSTPLSGRFYGGAIRVSNAGSGTTHAILANNMATDYVELHSVDFDRTKVTEHTAGTNVRDVTNEIRTARDQATLALKPTTSGRTLDVTATGAAGIDFGNVENPTTTLNLSGTTISTSQAVASVSGAVGSVTGAVGSVTGNVGGNVTGSVGSVSGNVGGSVASVVGNVGGNVTGSVASVVGAVGSVTGNVGGNVTGSVGSVSGVTFPATVPSASENAAAVAAETPPEEFFDNAPAGGGGGGDPSDWSTVKATIAKLDDTVEDPGGGNYRFTSIALAESPVGEGGGLDAAGVRAAIGLASANLDTQLADLPTNSEFNARSLPNADYFVTGDYTPPPSVSDIMGGFNSTAVPGSPTAGTYAELFKEMGADAGAANARVQTGVPNAAPGSTNGVARTTDLESIDSVQAVFSEEAAEQIAAKVVAARGDYYPPRALVWVLQRDATNGIVVKDGFVQSKQAGETAKRWIDFAPLLGRNEAVEEIVSVTVNGSTFVITPDSDELVGNLLGIEITGGAAGQTGTVSFEVETTAGQELTGEVEIAVP